jgi:hypothetical protein
MSLGPYAAPGTISNADLLAPGEYVKDDGSASWAPKFPIRTLKVGDLELQNVVASVSPTQGLLLLGQSFLSRVGNWSVDNQGHALVLNGDIASHSQPVDVSPPHAPRNESSPIARS